MISSARSLCPPRWSVAIGAVVSLFLLLVLFLFLFHKTYQRPPVARTVVASAKDAPGGRVVVLPGVQPEGEAWSRGTRLFEDESLTLVFNQPVASAAVRIQADCNDEYEVRLYGTAEIVTLVVPISQCPGLRSRLIYLPDEHSFSSVSIRPLRGDSLYAVAHIDYESLSPVRDSFALALKLVLAFLAACAGLFLVRRHITCFLSAETLQAVPEVPRKQPMWWFSVVLGLMFAIIAVCALGYCTLGIKRGNLALCSPRWYGVALSSVACWLLAAFLLQPRRPASSANTTWRATLIWWSAITLYRTLPLVVASFPTGLFWEEHEAAFGGRSALAGTCGTLTLYVFNELGIGLAFAALGVSEMSIRVWAAFLGTLSCIFMERTCALLFPRHVAILITVLYVTSCSMTTSALVAEESFSIVLFCMTGCLFSFTRALVRQTWTSYAALGMFLGIAAMEYASLKPAILICPTVLICVSLRGAPGAVLRNILQRTQEMCVMAVPFVALAHPVLINTWNGGTALFEGRRAVMVGGAFFNYSKERLPVTYHSVLGYLRQLFLSGADFPPLVYSGIPQRPGLLTSIDTFLFMAAVVMWIVSCQQWLRSSRASRAALSGPVVRGGLWFFWTLLLLLYCSYFNPVVFSRRILVCVPLLLLFVGEGMALFLQRFPQRRLLLRTGILCVAVGALLYNGSSLHASLHSADFIGAFRSKTSAICAELSTRDASEKYLVGFDWPSDSVWYLGDTPIREWIKDTSRSGYDSWPCIRPSIFTAAVALEAGSNLAVLKALRQSPATYLLLMTRATAPSEINYPGSVSQSLLSRLQVRVDALRADILLEDCKYVPDSAWYLSAVCRIGGDHMRASSVAPE